MLPHVCVCLPRVLCNPHADHSGKLDIITGAIPANSTPLYDVSNLFLVVRTLTIVLTQEGHFCRSSPGGRLQSPRWLGGVHGGYLG